MVSGKAFTLRAVVFFILFHEVNEIVREQTALFRATILVLFAIT
jgi:hypothetical protein